MRSETGRRLDIRLCGIIGVCVLTAASIVGVEQASTVRSDQTSTVRPLQPQLHHVATGVLTASLTAPAVGLSTDSQTGGYWEVASNGSVESVNAPYFGSMGGLHLNEPIVGMASTPQGTGYWEVASDGGIFSFGSASFLGSMGGQRLNKPIVGMATDPATGGYWEVASDGGVFAFHAPFFGSMGGRSLNSSVVGIVATPTGGGYWEVASDGGVFAFGNAGFHGSLGGQHLATPVVGMSADPVTGGYWEIESDGGIFSFDAPFLGSAGDQDSTASFVGMSVTATANGYREIAKTGKVLSFGSAASSGVSASAPQSGSDGAGTSASSTGADSGTTSRGQTSSGETGGGGGTPGTGGTTTSNDYEVVGNKILEPNGKQFIPYGFVLNCLADKTQGCLASTKLHPLTDVTLIRSAASVWHADVIRLQVAPENLLSGSVVNQATLDDLVGEVNLINSLGMVAIITDQEEEYTGPPLPTGSATEFWRTIAAEFKDDPAVFFDLYNEPRISLATPTSNADWSLWRNGGAATVSTGHAYQFVGMQTLLDDIRAEGAQNIVIAEGINVDKNLGGIPRYALSGTNIAYGMEPDLTSKDDTPAEWAANWGSLSQTVPIMMEAFQDWPGAGVCNADSPTLLPRLFSYLQSMHLGLIAWTLAPGVLMIGNNPDDPTSYAGTTTQLCSPGTTVRTLASNENGPGQLIENFFTANSGPVPTG